MSDYDIITNGGRRCRWPASEKLRNVVETLDETASIREMGRHLGRKTLEVEILKEALDKSRLKKLTWHAQSQRPDWFPVSVVAETLSVSRSNLHARLTGGAKPRRRYHKAQDAAVVPLITALVAARPTYGYRRITALLNRKLRTEGEAPLNHKRVYRIMQAQNLLLARHYTERPDRTHNGKIVTLRSNLRWRSDGFEFTCWNGDIVRGAFIIDAHDREITAWHVMANAGISGSDVRHMMLAAVEAVQQPPRAAPGRDSQWQWLTLHRKGHPHLRPPDRPETLLHAGEKPAEQRHIGGFREHAQTGLRERHAATVLGLIAGWFEDYNENHPHSGLKIRSPREFISAQTATA